MSKSQEPLDTHREQLACKIPEALYIPCLLIYKANSKGRIVAPPRGPWGRLKDPFVRHRPVQREAVDPPHLDLDSSQRLVGPRHTGPAATFPSSWPRMRFLQSKSAFEGERGCHMLKRKQNKESKEIKYLCNFMIGHPRSISRVLIWLCLDLMF